MNRTSFICVVFAVFFLGAIAAEAAPIRYSVDWTAGQFAFADESGLGGAHIHLEALVDPATTTPTVSADDTFWPSQESITITGSAHADGTYFANPGWHFLNDVSGYSSGDLHIDSPADLVLQSPFEVDIGGYFMYCPYQLVFALPASFNTPAPDGTIFPYPFENSDLLVQSPAEMGYDFYSFDGGDLYSWDRSSVYSARAEIVPEPAAWILALSGFAGLCFLAQRRSRP